MNFKTRARKPLPLAPLAETIRTLGVAAVLTFSFAAAQSQSLHWDTDPAITGAQGGTGNWIGPNFWLNGASNQTWSSAAHAVFGGTAGSVTLNAPATVGGMTFAVEGYVLAGASVLTLAAPVIDVATASPNPDQNIFPSAFLDVPIGGTAGLVKNGLGLLYLAGNQANTYTGTTFINLGTVILRKDAGVTAVNSDIVIGDNIGPPGSAGLEVFRIHQIADSAKVTINSDGYWFSGGSVAETIHTLELNGGWFYGGVKLTAFKSLPNPTAGTMTAEIDLGGASRTFDVAKGAGAIDVKVTNSGAGIRNGGLEKIGAGTLELIGQHTYTTLQINRGAISVAELADAGIASPLGAGDTIGLDGGTLEFTGNENRSTNREVVLGAAGGRVRSKNLALFSLSGTIGGTGSLTTEGFVKLTGSNTFTGPVIVAGTILRVPSVADAGVNSPLGRGASIVLNGGALFVDGSGSHSTNRAITLTGDSSLSPGNGSVHYSGPISGTGNLVVTGPGLAILSGANTFSGRVDVYNASLRVVGGNAIPDTANLYLSEFSTPAALDLNNSNETIGSLAGGSATTGAITLGGGTLTVGANDASTSFDGVISGAGSVVKIGSGTLALTRASTFSGSMTIRSGEVAVNDVANAGVASPLGAGGNLILGGTGTQGTLVYSGANNDAFFRTVTLAGSGGVITVSNAAAALIIEGIITGTGALGITGPGKVVLDHSGNNHSGATSVDSAVLTQNSGDSFSEASRVILSNTPGSVLDLNGFNASIGSLAGGGALGGEVIVENTVFGVGGDGTSSTFSGKIGGSGQLSKVGTGTLTLNGANTYTGVTNASAGTLRLSGGNAIADVSPLVVSAGATAEFTNGTETIASLLGAGSVKLTGGNLAVGADNSGTWFDGVISGNGNLTKIGTSNLRLSAAPTHSGTTNVNAGTLTLNAGIAAAGGAITLGGEANLVAQATVNRAIAGAGTITASGPLAIGNAASPAGFNFGGTLAVGSHEVDLADADLADLGVFTTLGSGGRLGSVNGLRLAFSRAIVSAASVSASISGTVVHSGTIYGPTAADHALSLTGDVSGPGGFTGNIRFGGSFSPGAGPGNVSLQNFVFAPAHTLHLELGGLTPGAQHDRLVFTGAGLLDGELSVTLLGGFRPPEGSIFPVIAGGALTGAFDSIAFPDVGPGLGWDVQQTGSNFFLIVVPEPGSAGLILLATLVISARRRSSRPARDGKRLPLQP